MVHLVDDQQRAITAHLGEVQFRRRRDALVGGDVAGEATRRIGLVVGGAHAQGMAERVAPARIGEGLLGLQAQAVARHHPDHPLDRAGGDQGRGGDDGQQALAPARGDGGEDVAHAVELARRDRPHEPGDLGLVGTERTVLGQARPRMRGRTRPYGPAAPRCESSFGPGSAGEKREHVAGRCPIAETPEDGPGQLGGPKRRSTSSASDDPSRRAAS